LVVRNRFWPSSGTPSFCPPPEIIIARTGNCKHFAQTRSPGRHLQITRHGLNVPIHHKAAQHTKNKPFRQNGLGGALFRRSGVLAERHKSFVIEQSRIKNAALCRDCADFIKFDIL
jgi:hypothetical protein